MQGLFLKKYVSVSIYLGTASLKYERETTREKAFWGRSKCEMAKEQEELEEKGEEGGKKGRKQGKPKKTAETGQKNQKTGERPKKKRKI